MRILVHICCGPCSITVLRGLEKTGHQPAGFFFNPNIHPLAEYLRRRQGAAIAAKRLGIPLIFADTLPPGEQVWRDPWLSGQAASVPCEPHTAQIPHAADALPPAVAPAPWLRAVAGREQERCLFCWRTRLRKTAEIAASHGFDGFSTSLLFSRHQNHRLIRETAASLAAEIGPAFVYQDFRPTWREGVRLSKEWGVYRQQYCGCVFSEYERYSRDFAGACASPDS